MAVMRTAIFVTALCAAMMLWLVWLCVRYDEVFIAACVGIFTTVVNTRNWYLIWKKRAIQQAAVKGCCDDV